MRTELTREQREAVTRRDGSLLLSAGAGAGKTSVLVERFVAAVLQDDLPPGRILAITFTDRAAGELRGRVRARFIELGEREAARDVESAFVSTFHGFCVRLLRIHALSAGLDPDFRVLEEGLAGRLRREAFAAALGQFLSERGSPAVDLLAAYGADRVRSMILDIHEELRSRGEQVPRLPAAEARGSVDLSARTLRLASVRATEEILTAQSVRSGVRLERSLLALQRAAVLLGSGEQRDSEVALTPGELEQMKLAAANTGGLQGAGCEAYRLALEEHTRTCVDLHAARACGLLGELLERFAGRYTELKRSRGVLDFDDLELFARALLTEREDVRRSWSERFGLLMVDEFQDSNPRQLQILSALERENLCIVGDELQSIYGFRHADVNLFRARRAQLEQRDATITLARNFRARAPLLGAINAVFSQRFTDHYLTLIPGREEPSADTEEPLLELLLSDKRAVQQNDREQASEDRQPPLDGQERSPAVSAWRWAEARMLAGRVADLIATTEVLPGDVVLLLRALGDSSAYERALALHGIPTIAAVGGFWGHQQVGDLLCYLRTLANPLDELSLLCTLACPLVGISSDGLASVARAARAGGDGVWATVAAIDQHADLTITPGERASLRCFLEHLRGERIGVRRRPIAQLIERAIHFSGYEDHLLSQPWGQRRLANVHKLMRLAHQFESSEGRELRGFLDHVAEIQRATQTTEPDAPVEDGERSAVRLMSIHAAKGLEFPVVCIPDLGRAPNLRAPDLLVDPHAGNGRERIGLKLVSLDGSESVNALDFGELREERRVAEAQEEQRILYVAMTRARERLLLSAAVDFEKWPAETINAATIAWLGPALVQDLPALLNSDQQVTVQTVPESGGTRMRCCVQTRSDGVAPPPIARPVAQPAGASRSSPDRPTEARSQRAQLSLPGMDVLPAARAKKTLSYSSLSRFERCGYRYYLEDVLGLPEDRLASPGGERTEGLAGRSRGLVVHRLLESVDFQRRAPIAAQAVLSAARGLGVQLSDAEGAQIAGLVDRLAATDLAKRLAGARELAREQPFAFILQPLQALVTGVIDLSASEGDGDLLVVDYKSDRIGAREDLERIVLRQYATQRLLYGLAALHSGARRVEVVHWFLDRPEDWVSTAYEQAQRAALEEELSERAGALQRERFAVSASPHRELCGGCPGRRGLCSWEETKTSRERPDE